MIKRWKWNMIASRVCLPILILLLLILGTPTIKPVVAQSITFSAYTGAPDSTLQISGAGFAPGATYQVIFAQGTSFEQPLTPILTVTGTGFVQPVVIPRLPYGVYTLNVATSQGNYPVFFQVTPVIKLSASTGHVGDNVVVSGAGFNTNRTVWIIFNNSNIAVTSSNSYGVLGSASFQVPVLSHGNYNMYASDGTIDSPMITFSLYPNLISSDFQGIVGDFFQLTGTGFNANSNVNIYWDNVLTPISSVVSNAGGGFEASVTIPSSVAGNHVIITRDSGFNSASVAVSVNPSVTLTPITGMYGSLVSMTGTGFRSRLLVTATIDGINLVTQPTVFSTDISGSFEVDFVVPTVTAGSHLIRVSDGLYFATVSISIASTIEISADSGYIGSSLSVDGIGFTPNGTVIILYDNQTMNTVAADNQGQFSVTFDVPPSAAGQHSITARDLTNVGTTATSYFTVESVPPPTPNLASPVDGAQTTIQPDFKWFAVNDPSGVTYDLQVARDAGFNQMVIYHQGLTSTAYQLESNEILDLVKKNEPYYWRVRAVDGAGNTSPFTAAVSFFTQDSTPPGVPSVLFPSDGTLTSVLPQFRWTSVTDPTGVTYDLEVAVDSDFATVIVSVQGINAVTYQFQSNTQLPAQKNSNPFFWRVRAIDGAANIGEWSQIRSFYTEDSTPPAAPTLVIPSSGSKESDGTIRFIWEFVPDADPLTYVLEVALDSGFNQVLLHKEKISTTEYLVTESEKLSPTTGDPEQPYYWRVYAIDPAQNQGPSSEINNFYVAKPFQIRGWVLYTIIGIAVALVLAGGIFIGVRLSRPSQRPPRDDD